MRIVIWHPSRGAIISSKLSGGLRCAATTGYYLQALRANTHWRL